MKGGAGGGGGGGGEGVLRFTLPIKGCRDGGGGEV